MNRNASNYCEKVMLTYRLKTVKKSLANMEKSTLGSGLELRGMDSVSASGLVVVGTKDF